MAGWQSAHIYIYIYADLYKMDKSAPLLKKKKKLLEKIEVSRSVASPKLGSELPFPG